MGFKSQADQISHTLPATRQRCKLEVWSTGPAARRGDGQRSSYLRDTRKDIKRI